MFFNDELQKLAWQRNAPFISALPILERTPHGIRPKTGSLTKNGTGIHFTKSGIKLFANEIKRSLYEWDTELLRNQQMRPYPSYPHPSNIPPESQIPNEMKGVLGRIFSMALSFLPHA